MTSAKERAVEAGARITCTSCSGHGLVQNPNRWDPSPEECSDCAGSGSLWRYPRGAIARYYGGPLVGRVRIQQMAEAL